MGTAADRQFADAPFRRPGEKEAAPFAVRAPARGPAALLGGEGGRRDSVPVQGHLSGRHRPVLAYQAALAVAVAPEPFRARGGGAGAGAGGPKSARNRWTLRGRFAICSQLVDCSEAATRPSAKTRLAN